MITIENANAYFLAHTYSRQWQEYSHEQRSAAILQARRDLSRALGRPMRENEPPYAEGQRKRDEFAVYEQAIYTLLRTAQPEGLRSVVQPLDSAESVEKLKASPAGKFSMEALSWLGDSVRFSAMR